MFLYVPPFSRKLSLEILSGISFSIIPPLPRITFIPLQLKFYPRQYDAAKNNFQKYKKKEKKISLILGIETERADYSRDLTEALK